MEDDAGQAQDKSPEFSRKLPMLGAQNTDDMVSRPASRAVSCGSECPTLTKADVGILNVGGALTGLGAGSAARRSATCFSGTRVDGASWSIG